MDKNIPKQHEGGSSDTSSDVKLADVQQALQHFQTVKKRFFDVNSWGKITGVEAAEFSLMDKSGEIIYRDPEKGDYFRINIPGPDNETGDKYDWVQVEHLEHRTDKEAEIYEIRVRPCSNPMDKSSETAHFFDDDATSTFLIMREGNIITAEVHGRNEKPNTEDLSLMEKIRNTVVAIGGIILGSKFQWKMLTEGLVKLED